MKEIPQELKSLRSENLERVLWKDIKVGNIVYLYATYEGKQYGCGPFQVISTKERCLRRMTYPVHFFHYPEELYRLKI